MSASLRSTPRSLSSSSRSAGATLALSSASRTTCARSPRTSWHSETLTAIRLSGRPSSSQVRAWRTAVRSTQVPMSTIRPDSSARGTNSVGVDRAEQGRVPAQERLAAA